MRIVAVATQPLFSTRTNSPRLMVRSVAQRRVSNTQVGFSRLAHE